jgi:gliding motility-associated-like protein
MGESVLPNAITTEVGGVFNWPQINSSNSSVWVSPQVDANYIVTYAALNGCIYSDTSFISVNELPEMFMPNISICNGDFFELNPIPNWYIYNWSLGLTNNTPILLNSNISPTVEIINPISGCKNYDTISIVINPLPQASFNYDCEAFPPSFINSSLGSLLSHWEFNGNTFDLESQVPLIISNFESEDITLTLIAESEFGCKDSISRKIILANFCYVPNTFTPDGDEYNNVFVPIFNNYFSISDYELTIFNRWGELIFTSYNPIIGWDGVVMKNSKKAQDDVYTWCLKYNDMSCPKRKELIGHVSLIK